MKLRAPKGEGALDARRARRPHRAASSRSSAARRSLRRRHGVGGLLDRLVGVFGRDQVYVELQRHLPPRRGGRQRRRSIDLAAAFHVPLVATNGVRFATPTSGRCSTCSPASATRRRSSDAGRRLAPNAERYLKPPAEMAALFADLPDAVARHARRSPIACSTRWPISATGFPTTRCRRARRSRRSCGRSREVGARERYRPYHDRGARADRARARSHREARSRRLLPHRLGHRQFLPPAATSSCRGAGRPPTAPCATASGSRPSIRSAWTCCSSASCRRSAASGPTSISICRAAIGASASSSTSTRSTAGTARR